MVDTIWVAVIGVAGALLGSVVGGLISYCTVQKQSEARLAELTRQLEHNERELRRDRLIQSRTPYLSELREAVSKWKVQLTYLVNKIDDYGHALLLHKESPFLFSEPDTKRFKQEMEEIKGKMGVQKEKIESLLGETCDSGLNGYIDAVFIAENSVSENICRILNANSGGFLPEEIGKILEKFNDVWPALEKISETSIGLRNLLRRASRRIEELLIGDESKSEIIANKAERGLFVDE